MFLLIFSLILTLIVPVSAQSSTGSISEITLSSGYDARETLEKGGFTVLGKNLNDQSYEDDRLYLGYKKGGTPITGLLVCYSLYDETEFEGATYRPVSDINLNAGVGGNAIYLYFTTDNKVGKGISALSTIVKNSVIDNNEDILKNDGSLLVKTEDGALANLDEGLSSTIYLVETPVDIVRPYVGSVYVASGSSFEEAQIDAAEHNFPYYLEDNLSNNGNYSMIAYSRVENQSDAITCFSFSADDESNLNSIEMDKAQGAPIGSDEISLFYTKSSSVGNPILDISANDPLFPGDTTLGNWGTRYFEGFPLTNAQLVIANDANLEKVENDTTSISYIHAPHTGDVAPSFSVYLTLLKDGLENKMPEETPIETKETIEETQETKYDDIIEGETMETIVETLETTEENADMIVGSVIGPGNLAVIFICLAVLLIAAGALVIFSQKKKKKM